MLDAEQPNPIDLLGEQLIRLAEQMAQIVDVVEIVEARLAKRLQDQVAFSAEVDQKLDELILSLSGDQPIDELDASLTQD